jgi:ABC-2 type transport system permease protein
MKGFRNIFLREIRRIFTSKDLLLLCFGAPFLYGIILSSVYSHKRVDQLPVGVVDNDMSKLSRQFSRLLSATQNISITSHYINSQEAYEALINDELSGFIIFPKGYAEKINKGQNSYISVAINSANIIMANPMLQSVTEVSGAISSGIFISNVRRKGIPREKASALNQPIAVDTQVLFNRNLNYSDFMLPGLIFAIMQQIILVGLGFSMAQEHENGKLKELHTLSGENFFSLLCGKTMPYIITNFAISMAFICFLLSVFDIRFQCGLFAVSLYTLVFVTAVTSLGMLMSSFFKNTVTALIVLMFYSMPTFLISGYSWPYYAMPAWLKIFGLILPSTFFFDNFRMLLTSGMPLYYLSGSIAVLLTMTVIYGFAAFFVLKKML